MDKIDLDNTVFIYQCMWRIQSEEKNEKTPQHAQVHLIFEWYVKCVNLQKKKIINI